MFYQNLDEMFDAADYWDALYTANSRLTVQQWDYRADDMADDVLKNIVVGIRPEPWQLRYLAARGWFDVDRINAYMETLHAGTQIRLKQVHREWILLSAEFEPIDTV